MKADVHNLRGQVFNTAGPAMGHVEKRSPKRAATADAQRLADALADFDAPSDDRVVQIGRELGWSPERTLAAFRSAMRTGLVEAWSE